MIEMKFYSLSPSGARRPGKGRDAAWLRGKGGAVTAALFLSLLIASCSSNRALKGPRAESVFFPPPPDSARVQYLTRITGTRDMAHKRSFWAAYIIGAEEERELQKPYGLAVRAGKLYICDTMLNGLAVVDLGKRTLDYFIPSGAGRLKKPINCCFDPSGNLYVADSERGQVVVFDAAGNYLQALGDPRNEKPTDVAVADGKLLVVDLAGHVIRVYALPSLVPLHTFPQAENGSPDYLYSPTNIAVRDSLVYVSDMGDCQVKVFGGDGRMIRTVGSRGLEPGRFTRPKGLAIDSENNLYVVDSGFENVQIFDEDGSPLMFFGGNYEGAGRMWLPAKVAIDDSNLGYFRPYVDPQYEVKRLIFVTNQYGPDKISVYGLVSRK